LKTIRTIIVDDEQHCVDALQKLLQTYCPEVEIILVCYNGQEAIDAIQKHKPQLVFMDVEMPFFDGFQVVEHLKNIDFPIVFTTAHSEYAVRAFRFSITDFLLKPIDDTDFQAVIKKLKANNYSIPSLDQITLLKSTWKNTKENLKKLALPVESGLIFVEIENIIYCQSDGNYTTLFFKDGKSILVTRKLKEMEELLEDKPFFRIHNQHIINLNCIDAYQKGDGGEVTLSNTTKLRVSRLRRDDFLAIWSQ
jgi:two-component system, LytTR family, response regulator